MQCANGPTKKTFNLFTALTTTPPNSNKMFNNSEWAQKWL